MCTCKNCDPEKFHFCGTGKNFDRRSKELFYDSFCHGTLKVNVGDYVLVRNDDSIEPESPHHCYVAQVEKLFTKDDDIPNCAQVQWFSRILELPPRQQKMYNLNYHFEVVMEKRRQYSTLVDAETVFKKCEVVFLNSENNIPKNLVFDSRLPIFYCRWMYDGRHLKSVKGSPTSVRKSLKIAVSDDKSKFLQSDPRKRRNLNTVKKDLKFDSDNEANESEDVENIMAEIIQNYTPKKRKILPKVSNTRISPRKKASSNGENLGKLLENGSTINKSKEPQQLSKKLATLKGETITRSGRKVKEISRFAKENDNNNNSDCSVSSNDPYLKKTRSQKHISPIKIATSTEHRTKSVKMNGFSNKKSKPISLKEAVDQRAVITRSGRKVKPVSQSAVLNDNDDFEDSVSESSFSDLSSESSESDCSESDTLVSPKKAKSKLPVRGDSVRKRNSRNLLKSIIPSRSNPVLKPQNKLEEARARLHISAAPNTLPCREHEFADIYSFVEGKLLDGTGGCMYISGVPGTGKTATVHEVIHCLEKVKDAGDLPFFQFAEINGMKLTDPHKCYAELYEFLTKEKVSSNNALQLLEKRFTKPGPKKDPLVVLIDELDLLWTRKQDVMYNIFDWPIKPYAKLIVLAIANTMDLPERIMMNRVSSRLGLTRMVFHPYTHRQLQEIIHSRIEGVDVFDPDAVQLIARKIAAISGDARRALDICRRATEIAELEPCQSPKKQNSHIITMKHVDQALQDMFFSPKIVMMRSASLFEKMFLNSVVSEFHRTGVEETTFAETYKQLVSLCRLEGYVPPLTAEASAICGKLGSCRIILIEHGSNDFYQRIRLNVSVDDVKYALQ